MLGFRPGRCAVRGWGGALLGLCQARPGTPKVRAAGKLYHPILQVEKTIEMFQKPVTIVMNHLIVLVAVGWWCYSVSVLGGR